MKQLILLFTLYCIKIVSANCSSEFVILIASYNNENYAEANLDSACWQNSSNPYHIIYINDCSNDDTQNVVDNYIIQHQLQDKVTVIHNSERKGALANIYNAIHELIDDHKIVISLDGDDMLAHNNVISILESYYEDPNIWMTYGTERRFPKKRKKPIAQKIPDWVFEEGKLREYKWVSDHLRTFKAGLFKKIKKEDLLFKGSYMDVAWDVAIMFPMLEMCAPSNNQAKNHSCYVQEIVYLYRIDNPISDFRIKKRRQKEMENFIRHKEPYKPLSNIHNIDKEKI